MLTTDPIFLPFIKMSKTMVTKANQMIPPLMKYNGMTRVAIKKVDSEN